MLLHGIDWIYQILDFSELFSMRHFQIATTDKRRKHEIKHSIMFHLRTVRRTIHDLDNVVQRSHSLVFNKIFWTLEYWFGKYLDFLVNVSI